MSMNQTFMISATILLSAVSAAAAETTESVLLDFEAGFEIDSVEARDITLELVGPPTNRRLQLSSGHNIDWPGVTFKPEDGLWDASRFQHFSVDVTNAGDTRFELGVRIDNPGGDQPANNLTVMSVIGPGESRTISAALYTTPWKFSAPIVLEGMHAAPGQSPIDPKNITQVSLFLRQPDSDHRFTIDNVRFETPMAELDPEKFLPFIDEFGQFIHDDWPGKTHSQEELIARRQAEQKQLSDHPGPASFDRFGGWKNGPQRQASKFFRVEKVDGKWWFVDPDGKLFWSHGIAAVSTRFGGTGTQERESYFRDLPAKDDAFGKFYGKSDWALGFYERRTPYTTYNFLAANLYRKYGEDWRNEFAELAHKRLRNWGMNTLAAWSDPSICLQGRTPYTAFFRVESSPELVGADKMWTRFVDVFDPGFRPAIGHGIATCKDSLGDPWCIGFYVDNELYWGNDIELALWTLRSPNEQAAKQEFVRDLQAKYKTVEALNTVWETKHETWEQLLATTQLPDPQRAGSDLRAFTRKFSETYFRTIKEELAAAAPEQLYLGCRFIWDNESAIRAACKFCDVVSFNRYLYSIENLGLPGGEDKPVLIGEFHFGATDRGMFHPSKVPSRDQQHRAECYKNFVHSALGNPLLVGTHWFQYTSEPTSGRGDGENYQVGFVDLCDTPYEETISAARAVGGEMYEYRTRQQDTTHGSSE